MKMPTILSVVMVVVATIALSCPVQARSADKLSQESTPGFELICLTEQPAIVEGDSPLLRAWVSSTGGRPFGSPTHFEWQVETGRIENQSATTRWDLSMVKASPKLVRKVIATVKATRVGEPDTRCSVEIYIGRRTANLPVRVSAPFENLFSAKRFLLPGESEAPGYGLYSYLLFAAPPKNAEEKERYLKTTEAYLLMLQEVDDFLRRHVQPKRLNATFIPLKRIPKPGKTNAEWAANVLDVYDYAMAQILLSKVRKAYPKGPYLLSVLSPLSQSGTQAYLWEDLTGVVPKLAWDWVRFFTYLAAQERSWSEVSLQRLGMTLRNLVAVGGKVTPDFLNGIEKMIKFETKG